MESVQYTEQVNPVVEEIDNYSFKYIFLNFPDGIVVRSGQRLDWSMSMYDEDNDDLCYVPDDVGEYSEV